MLSLFHEILLCMIRCLLFILFVFSSIDIFSQKYFLEGTVKDQNGDPISYVNVASLNSNVGSVTNKEGYFALEIKHGDSIKLSHICYDSRTVVAEKDSSNTNIILDSSVFDLNQVAVLGSQEISQKSKIKDVGYFKHKGKSSYNLGPGNQLGVFIENTHNLDGLIKNIKIKIAKKGKCSGEIRVRLLNTSIEKFQPDQDLIQDNLIFPISTIRKNLIIDVSNYNIIFPKKGLFVIVEWLYSDDICEEKSSMRHFSIASTLGVNKNLVWLSYMDKKWSKKPVFSNMNIPNFVTPKISLDIKY